MNRTIEQLFATLDSPLQLSQGSPRNKDDARFNGQSEISGNEQRTPKRGPHKNIPNNSSKILTSGNRSNRLSDIPGKALMLIRLGGAVPSSSSFFISHHEALSTGNESSLTSQMENYTENNTYNPRPSYQQPCGPPKSPANFAPDPTPLSIECPSIKRSKTHPLRQTKKQKPTREIKRASEQAGQSQKASGSSKLPKRSMKDFLDYFVAYRNENGNLTGCLDSYQGEVPESLDIHIRSECSRLTFNCEGEEIFNLSNDGLLFLLSFVTYLVYPGSRNPDIISQLRHPLNWEHLDSISDRLESFYERMLQKNYFVVKLFNWQYAFEKTRELFRRC